MAAKILRLLNYPSGIHSHLNPVDGLTLSGCLGSLTIPPYQRGLKGLEVVVDLMWFSGTLHLFSFKKTEVNSPISIKTATIKLLNELEIFIPSFTKMVLIF